MEAFFLDRVPLCVTRGKVVTAGAYRTHGSGAWRGSQHEPRPSVAWALLDCRVVFTVGDS